MFKLFFIVCFVFIFLSNPVFALAPSYHPKTHAFYKIAMPALKEKVKSKDEKEAVFAIRQLEDMFFRFSIDEQIELLFFMEENLGRSEQIDLEILVYLMDCFKYAKKGIRNQKYLDKIMEIFKRAQEKNNIGDEFKERLKIKLVENSKKDKLIIKEEGEKKSLKARLLLSEDLNEDDFKKLIEKAFLEPDEEIEKITLTVLALLSTRISDIDWLCKMQEKSIFVQAVVDIRQGRFNVERKQKYINYLRKYKTCDDLFKLKHRNFKLKEICGLVYLLLDGNIDDVNKFMSKAVISSHGSPTTYLEFSEEFFKGYDFICLLYAIAHESGHYELGFKYDNFPLDDAVHEGFADIKAMACIDFVFNNKGVNRIPKIFYRKYERMLYLLSGKPGHHEQHAIARGNFFRLRKHLLKDWFDLREFIDKSFDYGVIEFLKNRKIVEIDEYDPYFVRFTHDFSTARDIGSFISEIKDIEKGYESYYSIESFQVLYKILNLLSHKPAHYINAIELYKIASELSCDERFNPYYDYDRDWFKIWMTEILNRSLGIKIFLNKKDFKIGKDNFRSVFSIRKLMEAYQTKTQNKAA